ncbi:hypothetical protein GCM10023196_071090 [Actinoallomurus vinaceus]|uniref:Uncharacterized protein n=1 Tax=Actinoallomurus vinaceus TaxID=1080074 RepID=A0ABP8UKM6_9ACTN
MVMPDDRARTHIPPPVELWPISELMRQVGRLVAEELERPGRDAGNERARELAPRRPRAEQARPAGRGQETETPVPPEHHDR